MADDLVFEQEMKINGTVPNCLSDIENYAIGRMGGKEFIVVLLMKSFKAI